jgi:hypothetical protein
MRGLRPGAALAIVKYFLYFFSQKNPAFRRGLCLCHNHLRLAVEHGIYPSNLFASSYNRAGYITLCNPMLTSDFRVFQTDAFDVINASAVAVDLEFVRKDLVVIRFCKLLLHTFDCASDLREAVGVHVVRADEFNEVVRCHVSIIAQKVYESIRYFHAKRNKILRTKCVIVLDTRPGAALAVVKYFFLFLKNKKPRLSAGFSAWA